MALGLASVNVENLSDRAKALNTTTWAEGQGSGDRSSAATSSGGGAGRAWWTHAPVAST
jgi:hypothetical protein